MGIVVAKDVRAEGCERCERGVGGLRTLESLVYDLHPRVLYATNFL